MGWMVSITLLIFYGLGAWVFHVPEQVRVIPIIATVVFIIDRLLILRYRSSG